MTDYQQRLAAIGIRLPEIILPAWRVNLSSWPVVACDQFTSEPQYWHDVSDIVGTDPSTFNLIYPECFLTSENRRERIASIQDAMTRYIEDGVFQAYTGGVHVVVRDIPGKPRRTGILLSIDLDLYDYSQDSISPIRPTEGTIVERIPARKEIREAASLELPHVLVLLDDPGRTVVEPVLAAVEGNEALYSIDLMKNGGHLTSYRSDSPDVLENLTDALENLVDPAAFNRRFPDKQPFYIAIGDGNHSLAAAKTLWEETKAVLRKEDLETHPARYAMVEAVNIYDTGITFEPIHRLLFGVDAEAFILFCLRDNRIGFDRLPQAMEPEGSNRVGCVAENLTGVLRVGDGNASETTALLQGIVDDFLKGHGGSIDFVHDLDTATELGSKSGNIGLVMPAIQKDEFFPFIIRNGAFPRKSFSMGESREKRYYMEARVIKPNVWEIRRRHRARR